MCFRPASGNARPTTSRLALVLSLVALAPIAVLPPHVHANLPAGAQVVHGDVSITQAGGAMNIQQASRHAIVNWQSFNIGVGNSVRIEQGGANAAMLARVTGGETSQLLGSLKADGKLFLINPRGIVVGEGAVIDTAGFLGSTLDASDAEFLGGGAMTFKGESDASVVNLGKITAREGDAMLLAHRVKNAGEIHAPNGKAALGAGSEVYVLPENGSFAIKLNLAHSTAVTGVENTGTIAAAQAELNAAGGSIYELAVNQSGVIRATGAEKKNGRVLLTASGGTIGVSGQVSARDVDGSGGEILVGGDFQGKGAAVANATRTVVTSTAKLDASATTPAGAAGRVIVWADDATRFLGTIDARGQGGGFAEVSGKRWLEFDPSAPVLLGDRGTLLLDPDALIVSADGNSGTSTSGTNPFVFGATTEPATLNVTTLQNQLALTNVTLDTSTSGGDVTFSAAVTWSTNNTLRVQAGGSIFIDADITGGADSTLALYPGRMTTSDIPGELGGQDLNPLAVLDAGAAIAVGTLVYGANGASNVADQTVVMPMRTGTAQFYGNLNVGTLEVDLSGGEAGVSTEGSDNAIGSFRTSGTGGLGFTYVADHHGGLDVKIVSESSPANVLIFETPGTLTLLSGTSLSFENERDIILASSGAAFVNQAGADAFGENVRFLIYSSSPGATTKGGLAGTDVFNHIYDINDDFSGDRVSRFLYTVDSALPTLTYTANSFARTYGAANPAFTYATTGWQEGVTNDVTGTPTLSTTATQQSGVGSYTIHISQGSLASTNYDFAFVDGTLAIERAPLAISANNKTRRIGLENPTFDAAFSGFVLGEDVSALGGTLAFATSATSSSPAGLYAITPSGLTSANYQITFVPGTLTLTETAALLISANNATRTYGAANPTFTASYNGFVGSDTASIVTGLQFSTTATQSSGIGTYAITPFGATAPGYDISYEPGTLTIERAPLTISVPNQSRVYGEANHLTANFNGLVNGETSAVVSGLSLSTAATPASNVGNYAISASGATADNYSISYSLGSLTVTPAPLAVTIADATRRYGDPDPVFGYSVSGLKNGDSASLVRVDNLASLASPTSGVGAYGIVGFPWVASSNYTVPSQVSGTLTIVPRPLTITANNATRVYGDPNPEFTATFAGLASFDTPALFGNLGLTTQATQSSGVGNWGITFVPVANPNYTITGEFGTLTITPAPLSIVIADASRNYRQANPDFTYTLLGLRNNDTAGVVSGLTLSTAATQSSDAGSYAITGSGSSLNYALTFFPGTLTVNRLPATIRVNNTGRVFGDPTTSFLASFSGFFGADLSLAQSNWAAANPDTPLLRPGTYAVGFTEVQPDVGATILRNYDVTFIPGQLSIARRLVEIVAQNARSHVAVTSPTFPVTVSGTVSFGPTFTAGGRSPVTSTSEAGYYPIIPEIVEVVGMTREELNDYYDFRMTPGVLTFVRPPVANDNVDLNPGTVLQNSLNGSKLINTNLLIEDETVEVEKETPLHLATRLDVDYHTEPLTSAQYAAYFGSYSADAEALRNSLGASYKNLLEGKGDKDSDYENMSPATRDLLARWMDGALTVSSLQALIAQGDPAAVAAFSFILPAIVERTRDKVVTDLTPLDRQVLGRLADLTEKRRNTTALIAERKYQEMLKANAARAESSGLANLFVGPGDFRKIVEGAQQEALASLIGGSLGAAAAVGTGAAASTAITTMKVLQYAIFPHLKTTVTKGTSFAGASAGLASAGPAVAAMMAVVLAVRAVEVGESVKNETEFKALMNSWKIGDEITVISRLQSDDMNNDMRLSTMMLAAELLTSKP